MQAIWKRIEGWLITNNPQILTSLLPGASREEFEATEELLCLQLPEDMKKSYQIHDGQATLASPLMSEWQLLPLQSIRKQWEIMKELLNKGELDGEAISDEKVQANWWSLKWIPIAYNGAGDFYCLDLDPTIQGDIGQVIYFGHMSDKREVVSSSFQHWLEEFAENLEAGNYQVRKDRLVLRKMSR